MGRLSGGEKSDFCREVAVVGRYLLVEVQLYYYNTILQKKKSCHCRSDLCILSGHCLSDLLCNVTSVIFL